MKISKKKNNEKCMKLFYDLVDDGETNFEGFQLLGLKFAKKEFKEKINFSFVETLGYTDFKGAIFSGDIDFFEAKFLVDIDFSEATFLGEVDFNGVTFPGYADFSKAIFKKNADFFEANFQGIANFSEASFSGKTDFNGAILSGNAIFMDAIFKADAYFKDVTFSGEVNFFDAIFSGDAHFMGSRFSCDAVFTSVNFKGNTNFFASTFSGGTNFWETIFSSNVNFSASKFLGKVIFEGSTFFENADFGEAIFIKKSEFSNVKFKENGDFSDAIFKKSVDFRDSIFERRGSFNESEIQFGIFLNTELRHVSFKNVDLKNVILDGAFIEEAYIRDANWKIDKWGNYIIREELEANEADLICGCKTLHILDGKKCENCGEEVKDIWKEKLVAFRRAESVYRNIKLSLQNEGDYEKAGKFFFREMLMKRKAALKEKRYGYWLVSQIISKLCGYGEKSIRVLASAFMIVMLFALIYYFGQFIEPASTISSSEEWHDNYFLRCIYFSVVTFTTLGYGDFHPVSAGRPFAITEAFIGAFMIALFVLVFGRKMLR